MTSRESLSIRGKRSFDDDAPNDPIRILCVDDHPVVLDGMDAIIRMQSDMVMVGRALNADTALASFVGLRPDVTLMDLHLPGVNGITATRTIINQYPGARIVILTTYGNEERVRSAIDAGARGYLLKESLRTELLDAIRAVHRGEQYFPKEIMSRRSQGVVRELMTYRELDVLALMSKGMRNRNIAHALSIAEETVKVHVKHILRKLEAKDRTQAILIAVQRGIICLD